MKKWLLGLVLLVSVGAIAQPANYIHDRVRKRMPAGMFDSTLHVPRFSGSPSLRTGGSTNDGAIAIDTANGVFYFYHNSSWKRANLDTSNAFLTSVYRKAGTDSVFYVKGGTHTFAFKDSVGAGGGSTDTSVLIGDTLYTRILKRISDDSARVRSIRLQLNGVTVTPTETDSTASWNIIALTAESQGLQDVITQDSDLTANNTLNLTNHSLTLDSVLALYAWTKSGSGRNAIYQLTDNGFKAYSTHTGTNKFYTIQTLGLEETVRIESLDEDLVRGSNIDVKIDSLWFRASYGNYFFDSLQHSNSVTDKMLVWDSVNNKMATRLIPSGGGGSPAGNYGNVQVNRNGAFATPASDSLDFDEGLNIIGNLNASKFTWTGNSLYPYLALSGNDPLIYFGGTGAAYPSFGKSGGSAVIYGSSGTQSIGFYDQLIGGKQMLRLYSNGGGSAAVFSKTVISVDTAIGGPSDGSIMAVASRGDSTSMATGLSTHMFRGINSQYSNTNAANTFYGTVIYSNTNSSATGDHIVNWQSDSKKTGASTLDIIYHSAYLGDSIIAGTVNKRYGIKYWDAIVNGGALLGSQIAFKTDKLKAASGLNFHFLADSSHYAQLDGNILLGDTVLATSARRTLHIFNGTAPSASVANGVILYAEDVSSSSELKVRDEANNITTLSPHNFSLIPGGRSEEMAWAYYSERNGKKVNVDMMKLARLVEKLTGEKLVYIQ